MEEIKVKKNNWITLIAGIAIVLGLYTAPAVAQQPQQAQQTPFLVAVVDVAQLIRNHPDFILRQQALQEQVRQAEAVFQQRQVSIQNMQRNLDASPHPRGSTGHQELLDQIAYALAEFEKDAKTHQRRFALENSRIMYDVYKDIKATIGRFAEARNIAQVTDFRDFEPNPADPQSVAEDMDQRLVWFNPRLNITQAIINELQTSFTQRNPGMPLPTAAAPGAAPAPAAGVPQTVR